MKKQQQQQIVQEDSFLFAKVLVDAAGPFYLGFVHYLKVMELKAIFHYTAAAFHCCVQFSLMIRFVTCNSSLGSCSVFYDNMIRNEK